MNILTIRCKNEWLREAYIIFKKRMYILQIVIYQDQNSCFPVDLRMNKYVLG